MHSYFSSSLIINNTKAIKLQKTASIYREDLSGGKKMKGKEMKQMWWFVLWLSLLLFPFFFSCDSNIDVIKINEMAAKISIDAKKMWVIAAGAQAVNSIYKTEEM